MRYLCVLCGTLLFFGLTADAQENVGNTLLLSSPSFAALSTPTSIETSLADKTLASNTSFAAAAPAAISPFAMVPALASPAPPQDVYGVFQKYAMQLYGGYTFLNFHEVTGLHQNLNGFNIEAAYYFKDWLAADGEFLAAFGSQAGFSSHFLFGGGGPRFRWSGPRGIELWAHGLVGYADFVPQTPFGTQNAFAWEAGGGIDINAHHRRWAYRFEGDAVGTLFFNTYQISPKFSAGIVFKF